MRKGELDCIHGIGHSANNHGCDGCCFVLGIYERKRIIKLLEDNHLTAASELIEQDALGENK